MCGPSEIEFGLASILDLRGDAGCVSIILWEILKRSPKTHQEGFWFICTAVDGLRKFNQYTCVLGAW